MPRIKSSIKDVRKNRAQRAINRTKKSALKSIIKKARTTTPENRTTSLQQAYKVIDKAAQHGLIHKNTAARYKSRISRTKKVQPAAATA